MEVVLEVVGKLTEVVLKVEEKEVHEVCIASKKKGEKEQKKEKKEVKEEAKERLVALCS